MDKVNKMMADGLYGAAKSELNTALRYRRITIEEHVAKAAEIDALIASAKASKPAAPARGCYNPRAWKHNTSSGPELGSDF